LITPGYTALRNLAPQFTCSFCYRLTEV